MSSQLHAPTPLSPGKDHLVVTVKKTRCAPEMSRTLWREASNPGRQGRRYAD